jgi:NIMA (never in mitosis gene a)-related kinase 2
VTLLEDGTDETVFLGEDQSVKLGDFGLSKLLQSHDFASTYVGTPFYMSPEICGAEKYTLYSDIWSLGCIMYELCAKVPPFNAKTHIGLVQKIRDGKVAPLPSIYSAELRNVIGNCLKVNPTTRPDTAALLNLPVMRLMRKEKEVVDLGRVLRIREESALQKIRDLEEREAGLKAREELMRREITTETEATVRREWEVKARLEIDRQVQLELERLRKKFDREVQEKLAAELEKIARSQSETREAVPVPTSPQGFPTSSFSVNEDSDFPSSTDISDLSIDSPTSQPTKPIKKTRTPFSRSKTTFESPMDIQMSEPSPMSIASLSLSPRRNTPVGASSGNIFAREAEQKLRWEPKLAYSDDEEDDMPELASPTRPKRVVDPFKVPARPGLLRHNTTAAMPKLNSQPNLFPTANTRHPAQVSLPVAVSQPDLRLGVLESKRHSPNRRLSKIPSSTTLACDAGSPTRKSSTKTSNAKVNAGGEDMFKAVMQRNMGGRTLVELAQARAGGRPVDELDKKKKQSPASVEPKPSMRIYDDEVVWDPERDEMPSPFLIRGSRGMRPSR